MLIFPLWDYTALYVYTVGWGLRAPHSSAAQRKRAAQFRSPTNASFATQHKARTNALKRATARVRKRAAMLLYMHTKNAAKRV